MPDLQESYDFVIVGGGTAGCVLANRLSEDPDVCVLLVERGGVKNNFISRIPLLSSHFASDGSQSQVWRSVPQEHANNRVMELLGGNTLGGSSQINSMLYTRGLPAEFNHLVDSGCEGWGYDDMEQYFIKSETDLDHKDSPGIENEYHGTRGEWHNRSWKKTFWGHTSHLIQASKSLGLPYLDDLNSPLHPSHGCAKMHHAIDETGQRSSAFTAFLPPSLAKARKRNLHICARTTVMRIEVTNKNGVVAAEGVWIKSAKASQASRFIRARREVILSAGPIGSPHVLQLSGIGPASHLQEHGIPVMMDLPAVGSNLEDHLGVPLQFRIPAEDSLTQIQLRPWIFVWNFLLYLFFGQGLLISPVVELSIFLQSRLLDSKFSIVTPSKDDTDAALPQNRPDIELMPIAWGDTTLHKDCGFGFLVVTLRPTSVGTVRLASNDPFVNPIIDPNYLSTEQDLFIMRQALRFSIRLKDEMASQGYPIIESEAHVPAHMDDDECLDDFIRRHCRSTFHYSSTCRMGPKGGDDAMGAVVDERLKVHGVSGLRVADSSVFPHILGTHLAAATVALAEKCADMIKGDYQ